MAAMGKQKILLADDEAHIAKAVGKRLEIGGFEVIVVGDGQEALTKARAVKPNLIVLDWMLPTLNGGEVCKALKQDQDHRHIPIIIYTASAAIGQVKEQCSPGLGADAYLDKLEGSAALIAKIRSLLRT